MSAVLDPKDMRAADRVRIAAAPYFDAREIARLAPMGALIEMMGAALVGASIVPMRLTIQDGDRELMVMPGMANGFAGVKLLTMVPENSARASPVIGGMFVLFDMSNGDVVAVMDAGELTARRTAAVSALAARKLAHPQAHTLAILGSGHLAPYLAEAHASVRPIENIRVWARTRDKAEACVAAISARAPSAQVAIVGSARDAVAGADIVSAATRATAPIIEGAWLAPSVHLDLVGGYRPDMRELDDVGVLAADLIYVDNRDAVLAEAGDLISPLERGVIAREAVQGDLRALLTRADPDAALRVTLFKSVGSAAADLAAAECVWRAHNG